MIRTVRKQLATRFTSASVETVVQLSRCTGNDREHFKMGADRGLPEFTLIVSIHSAPHGSRTKVSPTIIPTPCDLITASSDNLTTYKQ